MPIRLVVLGSGQDGGRPQVGSPDVSGSARTASSIAVVADDVVVLCDASPDLRAQWSSLAPHLPERRPRHPFDAVAITHAHMGHYLGLAHFGKEAASTVGIPLVAPASMLSFLEHNEPWRALFTGGHVTGLPSEDGPHRYGRLSLTGVPVPHRAEFTSTIAVSIAVDGIPWALYLPDIDRWDGWEDAADVIADHRVALLDATFAVADEVPGRDLADIPHPLVEDTIARFSSLTEGRILVLTHINHTNALGRDDSPIAAAAREAGFTVAHDGMVIEWEA